MKPIAYVVSALIAGLVIYEFASNGTPIRAEKLSDSPINWKTNLEDAKALAKSSNRRVLIDFYGDACSACIEQDATTYRDAKVLAAMDRVVPVKVKLGDESNGSAFDKFSVSLMPTTVILSSEGREVARNVGYTDVAHMLELLKETK